MKILIATASFDRPIITKLVFEQLSKYKNDESKIYNIDDSSSTYTEPDLLRWGVDINEKTNRINIHQIRCKQLKNFCTDDRFKEFTHIYFTDNDAYHDPMYIEVLKNTYEQYKKPISLYNTTWHFNSEIRDNPNLKSNKDVVFRTSIPGISQLYDRDMANKILNKLDIPNIVYAWDYIFIDKLRTSFNDYTVTTRQSYIEHFGVGGIHNQSLTDFDRDKATSPTKFLRECRQSIIQSLLPHNLNIGVSNHIGI